MTGIKFRRLLFFAGVASLLASGNVWAGPACWTDLELMAEAAAAFLLAQETTARICDPALKPTDERAERLMTRMHDGIVEKFQLNFRKYSEARERRYRRWYGEQWKLQQELDRKRAFAQTMKSLTLGPGVCRKQRSELEIMLESNWDYIRAKLTFAMKRLRPRKKMCRQ